MPGGATTRMMRRGRGGFTLAEALLASVVMATVATSCMLPLLASAQQVQESERIKYATELGQALMEEISARAVSDARVSGTVLGPGPGETSRKAYCNVDAFHGLSETTDGVLRDYEGAAVAGSALSGFTRSATVQYVNYAGQAVGDTGSFVLITVNVFHGSRPLATFTRLMTVEL